MIFDSCQTRNVIMYDTLSQGKGNNNNDKWDEENEKKKLFLQHALSWFCPNTAIPGSLNSDISSRSVR